MDAMFTDIQLSVTTCIWTRQPISGLLFSHANRWKCSLSVAEQTVDTVCLVTQSLPPLSLQSIADTSATDSLILELKEAISTNWPAKYKTNVFYPMRNELSVSDDGRTVFFKSRIILPECLQKKAPNASS